MFQFSIHSCFASIHVPGTGKPICIPEAGLLYAQVFPEGGWGGRANVAFAVSHLFSLSPLLTFFVANTGGVCRVAEDITMDARNSGLGHWTHTRTGDQTGLSITYTRLAL